MKCTHRYVFALDVQMSVLQLSAKVCAPTRFFLTERDVNMILFYLQKTSYHEHRCGGGRTDGHGHIL